jgi:hypothetical protein
MSPMFERTGPQSLSSTNVEERHTNVEIENKSWYLASSFDRPQTLILL